MKSKLKFLILIFVNLFIVNIINVNAEPSKRYEIQRNYDVNPSFKLAYLIKIMNSYSRFKCLSECNLNNLCQSVSFNQTNSLGICSLYSTNFTSSQLISSINYYFFQRLGFYFTFLMFSNLLITTFFFKIHKYNRLIQVLQYQ
jgi:hypothetical protein